jgi:hypothetical protein
MPELGRARADALGEDRAARHGVGSCLRSRDLRYRGRGDPARGFDFSPSPASPCAWASRCATRWSTRESNGSGDPSRGARRSNGALQRKVEQLEALCRRPRAPGDEIQRDLERAESIQRALLPSRMPRSAASTSRRCTARGARRGRSLRRQLRSTIATRRSSFADACGHGVIRRDAVGAVQASPATLRRDHGRAALSPRARSRK